MMRKALFFVFFLNTIISFSQKEVERPNIIWIVCEDISPTLSFYGDATAKTPNLDALAKESIIFDNAFATTPVCAPSRSAIITGMLPSSIGTMHMRTGRDIQSWSKGVYKDTVYDDTKKIVLDLKGKPIREYSAVIPEEIKCFSEIMRANGYYCTNNQKTDYQFAPPQSAWDENDGKATWKNAPKGVPFFSVFNFEVTHESRIWKNKDLPLTVHPQTVPLPPYYPDNSIVRTDVARHYSNIEILDKEVGALIAKLKSDNLFDNTIIFFYSDHGGPLPHQKREIYDSGLKVPLIIRFPKGEKAGRNKQMVSFTDLAPTVLSLANIEPPKYMDGQAFLGKFKAPNRKVVFGTSDRFDEFADRIRAVRDSQYLYVKNYHTTLPKYKDVFYRKSIPMMNIILELHQQHLLNQAQEYWFQPKAIEELYDCKKDPYQLHNLASNPKFQKKLKELRICLEKQFESKVDFGVFSEAELILKMWPNFVQPKTDIVEYKLIDNKIALSSSTVGASISYQIVSKNTTEDVSNVSAWKLYTKPFALAPDSKIIAKASRIGFKESEISNFDN